MSPAATSERVQVYVWEWPVRVTHWLIALAVVVLAATGFYIGHPILIASGPAGQRFVMGTVKVIHSYAAIVFTLSVLTRIAWLFLGNRYARWDKFLPVAERRRRGLGEALRFYLFRRRQPPDFVGHNPLAGLTYVAVFSLYLVQIATGFALYSASAHVDSPMRQFGFLQSVFEGVQTARWIHHVGMWMLLGFVVHHVYSAVLMSQIEANATVESMFSGYKFVPPERLAHAGDRAGEPQQAGG